MSTLAQVGESRQLEAAVSRTRNAVKGRTPATRWKSFPPETLKHYVRGDLPLEVPPRR